MYQCTLYQCISPFSCVFSFVMVTYYLLEVSTGLSLLVASSLNVFVL